MRSGIPSDRWPSCPHRRRAGPPSRERHRPRVPSPGTGPFAHRNISVARSGEDGAETTAEAAPCRDEDALRQTAGAEARGTRHPSPGCRTPGPRRRAERPHHARSTCHGAYGISASGQRGHPSFARFAQQGRARQQISDWRDAADHRCRRRNDRHQRRRLAMPGCPYGTARQGLRQRRRSRRGARAPAPSPSSKSRTAGTPPVSTPPTGPRPMSALRCRSEAGLRRNQRIRLRRVHLGAGPGAKRHRSLPPDARLRPRIFFPNST